MNLFPSVGLLLYGFSFSPVCFNCPQFLAMPQSPKEATRSLKPCCRGSYSLRKRKIVSFPKAPPVRLLLARILFPPESFRPSPHKVNYTVAPSLHSLVDVSAHPPVSPCWESCPFFLLSQLQVPAIFHDISACPL